MHSDVERSSSGTCYVNTISNFVVSLTDTVSAPRSLTCFLDCTTSLRRQMLVNGDDALEIVSEAALKLQRHIGVYSERIVLMSDETSHYVEPTGLLLNRHETRRDAEETQLAGI